MAFLPVTREEMKARGWQQPDFVLVTGDAYVDHPSFGHAIISRVLESRGYKVAVLPQPGWKTPEDFRRFGRPRLGFLITSGNVDSMVNHYSVFKRRRKTDLYSPGGKAGLRPDRAVIVYSNRAREAYKDVPVILGGIEASLRRLAHYDYWEDKLRRSILLDAKADLLIYGMGEKAVVEVAEALDSGIAVQDITWIRGTAYKGKNVEEIRSRNPDAVTLPSFCELEQSKDSYAKSFRIQYRNNDAITGRALIEPYGEAPFPGGPVTAEAGKSMGEDRRGEGASLSGGLAVVVNPPMEPLEQLDLDDVYSLPYERAPYPMYGSLGGIPAALEVKFSITANRGCFGGCAFCALTYHQGREVRGRSKESIVEEAKLLTELSDFKGYIHDIGGPTANFRQPACKKQLSAGVCKDKECMFPEPCSQLIVDHKGYLDILRTVRKLPKVKKVFIRSGIRYDYVLADRSGEFLEEIVKHHISGTLKVAPEHISKEVLARMRKPSKEVFLEFSRQYQEINRRLSKKQYLIPYLISSHPGSALSDALELALFLKESGFVPDQVQDFYPTPGTLATCMYYTGLDPLTGESVYVARDLKEKQLQRALLHFHKKENRELVREALEKAGRPDLIPVLR